MIRGVSVKDLASELGLKVIGDDQCQLTGVASMEDASEGNLSFIRSTKYLKFLDSTHASAVIVPEDMKIPDTKKTLLLSKNPYISFAKVLEKYFCQNGNYKGILSPVSISESAELAAEITVEPFVTIGDKSVVASHTVIMSNVRIGKNVRIGSGCVIHGGVSIEDNSIIGNNVILNPGVRIGSDGFGYTQTEQGNYKLPQIGFVEIGDDVEVGANSTIDRGSLGATKIGKGTKIDNLVQIGHGVDIGEHNVICAQVGIAGSVKTGEKVIFASKSGVGDHVSIGANSTIGPMAGVTKDLPENSLVSGFPAVPHQDWLKMMGAMAQLPSIRERFKSLLNN